MTQSDVFIIIYNTNVYLLQYVGFNVIYYVRYLLLFPKNLIGFVYGITALIYFKTIKYYIVILPWMFNGILVLLTEILSS